MSVYTKLLTVQNKLKAPKSQYNKFGKYYYRSCEDILEALKPILKEVNAILIISDSIENVGQRYYVKAICNFIDVETGENIITEALAREDEVGRNGMTLSQETGSTSSFARKYALNAMFLIDDNKDSDSINQDNENADSLKAALNKATERGKTSEAKPEPKEEPVKEVKKLTAQEAFKMIYEGQTLAAIFKMKDLEKRDEILHKLYNMTEYSEAITVINDYLAKYNSSKQ